MTSVTVITSIIVLLAALVCYAFIAQTISHKKQQRERLLTALKTRVRNFKYMLNGFPAGFLPKELTLLVQRSLMQLLEQLTKLEPNAKHGEDLQAVAHLMAETQRQPQAAAPPNAIDNPQKAREIKLCLEELYKFVFHLEGKRNVTRAQADVYRSMIRNQVLHLTVDSYVLHGRIAREKDKPRLAIHYFDLALKLMLKERASGQFDARIPQLRSQMADLESRVTNEAPKATEPREETTDQAVSQEWDKFAQEQSWKKKQVYD